MQKKHSKHVWAANLVMKVKIEKVMVDQRILDQKFVVCVWLEINYLNPGTQPILLFLAKNHLIA
jgi:hypothetical protein